MNAVDELEVIGENLATQYAEEIYTRPEIMQPLAQAIAKDTQAIPEKYPSAEAQLDYVSKELLGVMNGGVILINRFVQRIKDGQYDEVSEQFLLEELDHFTVDEKATAPVLTGMKQTLGEVVKQGLPIQVLLYDNYLSEYAANLMVIHVLSRVSQRQELLAKIHTEIQETALEKQLYQNFKQLTEQFKKSLNLQPYQYEAMLKD
ncbi:hypothetical protein [Enterococcus sp. LJL90]